MGYKYLKRGIRIGFSFTLGMMLLLSGCSGGMEEMQTSQIPEDMGSATGEEDVNLVELDSSIVELLGSILGTVFSAFLTDPLVAMLMRMEGISNFSSQPAIWIVLFPGLIVTVLFILFAWLAARKIKKAPLSGLTAE